jgi:hypothetical protein
MIRADQVDTLDIARPLQDITRTNDIERYGSVKKIVGSK